MDLPQDFAAYLLAEMNQTAAEEYVDLLLEICEYHSPETSQVSRSVPYMSFQVGDWVERRYPMGGARFGRVSLVIAPDRNYHVTAGIGMTYSDVHRHLRAAPVPNPLPEWAIRYPTSLVMVE